LRTIYFVRHGQPESGRACCCGIPESVLDPVGICQAQRLARYFETKQLSVIFTSPLPRCVQTAEFISGGQIPVKQDSALREMDAGLWEGLTFDEIKTRYPDAYAARGLHMGTVAPPGGESFQDAGVRLGLRMARLIDETSGDIAVVGHGGSGRAWLCALMGVPIDSVLTVRQPWGGVTAIEAGPSALSVQSLGLQPGVFPADVEIAAMLDKMDTPVDVRAHGGAVAKTALSLAETEAEVDRGLLRASCLLHDIARTCGSGHPAKGATLLNRAGWPAPADIVARHHDLGASPSAEAKLLYLADKLTFGESAVSLDTRFARSRQKCGDAQALAVWKRRYDDAMKIYNELQSKAQ